VGKAFEVLREAAFVRAAVKPLAEFRSVLRRESRVAAVAGEVDDGLRTQPAVEVFVEEDLGELPDDLGVQFHAARDSPSRRSATSAIVARARAERVMNLDAVLADTRPSQPSF
jgi:hypothetical protein